MKRLLLIALFIVAYAAMVFAGGPSPAPAIGNGNINGTDITPSSVSTASETVTVSTIASAVVTNLQVGNATATNQTVTGISSAAQIIAGTETVASLSATTLRAGAATFTGNVSLGTNYLVASYVYQTGRTYVSCNMNSVARFVAPNTVTVATWSVLASDTLGEMNISTGVFTAKKAGLYRVDFVGQMTGITFNSGTSNYISYNLYKNGSQFHPSSWWTWLPFVACSGNVLCSISATVALSVGDTLDIRVIYTAESVSAPGWNSAACVLTITGL